MAGVLLIMGVCAISLVVLYYVGVNLMDSGSTSWDKPLKIPAYGMMGILYCWLMMLWCIELLIGGDANSTFMDYSMISLGVALLSAMFWYPVFRLVKKILKEKL